jgi:hypothetical protein
MTPRAPRRPVFAAVAALALVVPAVLAACDSAPGTPDLVPQPPTLAGFTVSPDTFLLPGATPEAVIPLTLRGTVGMPDGSATLRYIVRRQGDDTTAVEGQVNLTGSSQTFEEGAELRLPRGASGIYLVEAVATAGGRAGGRGTGLFRFQIEPLGPPTVASVALDPPVVTPPATGAARLRVVATISDPDGRANIGYVALRPVGAEGPLLPLADNGTQSGTGDTTARDGQYTVTLQIGAGSPPGDYAFEIIAMDREGLQATPFPVTTTVQ